MRDIATRSLQDSELRSFVLAAILVGPPEDSTNINTIIDNNRLTLTVVVPTWY